MSTTTNKPTRLDAWVPTELSDGDHLVGQVQDHPREDLVDGHLVMTSRIIGREEDAVVTETGTRYVLAPTGRFGHESEAFLGTLRPVR